MLSLGSFGIEAVIAQGGAGEIWRGRHLEQGIDVAVKVLSPQREREAEALGQTPQKASFHTQFQAQFENEVRAVAGLTHPSIVTVYDYGQIPDATAAASDGALKAQRPYLIMELAEHSLRPWCGHVTWEALRSVLLSLLDALAHSHAREMIHLDLKAENVLVFNKGQRVKLTDFGLAYAYRQRHAPELTHDSGDLLIGTPAYMAPEQIKGEWRDLGPWTDLYALGCLAYFLASGALPYAHAAHFQELIACQLYHDIPKLKPSVDVPDGFEAWLRRLTAKSIKERFHRAADAAWALLQLDQATPDAPPGLATLETFAFREVVLPAVDTSRPPDEDANTLQNTVPHEALTDFLPSSLPVDSLPQTWGDSLDAVAVGQGLLPSPSAAAPPLPRSWSAPVVDLSTQLQAVGLGLFGLRAIPMVGRRDERDQLWEALHTATEQQSPQIVLLRGAAGCGKSRLAEWLTERAHEIGATIALKAIHNALPGPGDGLGPMCARFFGCVDLPHKDTIARLKSLFRDGPAAIAAPQHEHTDPDWGAIAELFRPLPQSTPTPHEMDALLETFDDDDDEGNAETLIFREPLCVRFGTSFERYETICQLLAQLCQQRTVVLWLDDVQWGADALEFLLYLQQQTTHRMPLLILATVRDEDLDARPYEATMLEQLQAHDNATTLAVESLPEDHRTSLIQRMLGLSPELTRQVATHTQGNPLFATQLLGEWIEGGQLSPTPTGFALTDPQATTFPHDLQELWSQRLERVLSERSEQERLALELAAALGHQIDGKEWDLVCQLACIDAPFAMIEHMLRLGLALSSPNGPRDAWSFAHESLRAAVEAQVGGSRWESHHHLCIEAIRQSNDPMAEERTAYHFLAASRTEEAIDAFLKAAELRIERSDYRVAEQLLSLVDEQMKRLDLPSSDQRWGELWLRQGQLALLRGDVNVAETWALRTGLQLNRHHWSSLHVRLLLLQAHIYTNTGRPQAALKAAEQATACDHEEPSTLAQSQMRLGRAYLESGRLTDAQETLEEAIHSYRLLGDDYGIGYTNLILSNVAQRKGNFHEAEAYTRRAIPHFAICGSRVNIAHSSVFLGEAMRQQGKLEEARQHYEHAIHLFGTIGAPLDAIPRSNIGLILMETQQYQEAYQVFSPLRQEFQRRGRPEMVATTHAFLFICSLFLGQWEQAQRHLQDAQKGFSNTEKHDLDVARFAQAAGYVAQQHQQHTLAQHAYEISLQQWQAMGRHVEAEQVKFALQDLAFALAVSG